MGIFGIGGFNGNNSYGIDKKEFKQIKKELKAYNQDANPANDISKKEIKEMEKAIKAGNLEAYLDKCSDNMKSALGLSLAGAVDKEGFAEAVGMAKLIKGADQAKVSAHLKADYMQGTPKSVEAEFERALVKQFSNITVQNEVALNYKEVAANLQNANGPFAELFA